MNAAITAEDLQRRLLTASLGRSCVLRDEVDSTNTLAASLAEEGAPDGLVVVAESQTQGRGRMQRRWQSPMGLNLYFSAVLRPRWNLAGSPPLSIAAGVAIAEVVEQVIADAPQLKWPNDVLVGGRKVAGILVEAAAQRHELKHIVLGIGVNVNQIEFPPELASRATSLALASGRPWVDRTEVLALLLGRLEHWIDLLSRDSQHAVVERWCSFAPWLGSEVRVTHGESSVVGTAIALETTGALRMRDEHGREQLVHCGDASGVMGWTY
jgi:BirA family biotin operon repressor/biotin-[acetyl-CoA-carboxylase] ligase